MVGLSTKKSHEACNLTSCQPKKGKLDLTPPFLNQTEYEFDSGFLKVVLVSPHGSEGTEFLKKFPMLIDHPQVVPKKAMLLQYLKLEQDFGATPLAHAVAKILSTSKGIGAMVVELDYPRGIIDGGRILAHCLREVLPKEVLKPFRQELLTIHQNCLYELYLIRERLNHHPAPTALIDMHTMAPFSPLDSKGVPHTEPVQFERLREYIDQFTHASEGGHKRSIDLIHHNERGEAIGDPTLLEKLRLALDQSGYPYVENDPYCADEAFLMQTHLLHTKAIAIDVPKDLVCICNHAAELDLTNPRLDLDKTQGLAQVLADGIHAALTQKEMQ